MPFPTTFVFICPMTIPKQAIRSRPPVSPRWEATSRHSIHKCTFSATTIRVATLLTCIPITREYQNGHAFHDESCQDSNILYPLPAPGLRSQPNLPNYHSQFPAQVHQDQPHGDGPYQSSLHDPSTPTREEHSFSCGWVDGKNGPCGFKGSRDAFKAHFLNVHLTGPQDGQIVCLWKGCSYIKRGKPEVHTMRRDSAWRHTREIHLGDKYRRVQAI